MTGLPINNGEEVVLFLLEKTFHEITCRYTHPHDEWAPRGIHLYGKYEDYGQYSVVDTPLARLTLESFREQLLEMDVGENEYHDIPVKLKDLSWKSMSEWIHESRLFVKKSIHGQPNPVPVTRVAILKKVFDEILRVRFGSEFGANEELSIENLNKSVAEYITAVTNHFQKFDHAISKEISEDDKKITLLVCKMQIEDRGPDGLSENNLLKHFAGMGGGSFYVSWGTQPIISLVNDLIMQEKIAPAQEILKECAKFNLFHIFFSVTRRRWVPTGGAGSQTEAYECHMSLARIIEDFCIAKVKERDGWQ